MLSKILSYVLAPYAFIVSFWRAFVVSVRYNYLAGHQLGEHRRCAGKVFTGSDIRALATELQAQDEVLAEHRRRYRKA